VAQGFDCVGSQAINSPKSTTEFSTQGFFIEKDQGQARGRAPVFPSLII
jgi:hypothetical protein